VTNSGHLLPGERRKRRHKVVIHTSPFLRCVQTSVAISAGLAQNPGHHRTPAPSSPAIKAMQMHSSPKVRPTILTSSPLLTPITEPRSSTKGDSKPQEQPENIKKSTIRVDAFLGEWLSPDYFEQITPPPSSVMMVAGAKADLLRREDYSALIRDISGGAPYQGFPGGWGSPVVHAEADKDESALSTLSSLGQALPRHERTSSLSSSGSHGSRHSHAKSPHIPAPTPGEHGVYKPPIPSYAISTSDPIPAGYVAHSRDACVDVDYQWDSMREPLNWGDGGEYGEEWSSMHKRFRKGLQHLVNWYSDSDDPAKNFTKIFNHDDSAVSKSEEHFGDDDTDLVIVLVTHGAGCNALIGALTNQPVLLDVGMASLTMAVRKPTPPNSPTSPGTTSKSHSRASSRTLTISEQYDVKLVANTEHLRTSQVTTPSASRAPSINGISAFRERFGGRENGFMEGSSYSNGRPVIIPGSFGSIRRTASVATSTPRGYVPSRHSSIGLWTAPQAQDEDEYEEATEDDPEDDMILNFGDDGMTKENVDVAVKEAEHNEEDDVAPLGLWGTPRPPGHAEKIREIAPKRRWTVTERGNL
jgi:hypothetical protein